MRAEVEAEETLITVEEFKAMCPGMKLPQARARPRALTSVTATEASEIMKRTMSS